MTDPWLPPDQRPVAPYGWGPPPEPPASRSRWVPVAALAAITLVAGIVAVAARSPRQVSSERPPPVTVGTPSPTTTPARSRAPRPSPTAKPQPVRTYTAPPSGIPVRGRVVDVSGRPVAGAEVRLTQHEGFFGGFARALTAFATLGLACLTEICEVPYGVGRTDSAGRYTVYLERGVEDYDLVVSTRSGSVSALIDFAGRPLALPDVVLWNPSVRLAVSGTRAQVRFAAPPARLGSWESAYGSVTTDADRVRETLLSMPDVHSGDTFDARLVEDDTVTLHVTLTVRGRLGKTTYSGRSAEYRGRLVPGSRGKPCFEYGRSGRPIRNAPCALTDGDLYTQWTPKVADYQCANGSPCDRRVTVDLGAVRRVRYVAARVCDPFFDQVESSVDGKSWQVLVARRSGDGGDDVCAKAVDVRARYVRVKGPAGGFYLRRSEISVFS